MTTKNVKLMTPRDVAHFRAGGLSPLGWPLQDGIASGRSVCRCCGRKITKGVPARWVSVSFTDNASCYASHRVWLHADECGHADGIGSPIART